MNLLCHHANLIYMLSCAIGLALVTWYELSKYTRNTIASTISMCFLALVFIKGLSAPDLMGCVYNWERIAINLAVIALLADNLIRKAILQPHGYLQKESL